MPWKRRNTGLSTRSWEIPTIWSRSKKCRRKFSSRLAKRPAKASGSNSIRAEGSTGNGLSRYHRSLLLHCHRRGVLPFERLCCSAAPAFRQGCRQGIGEDVLLFVGYAVENGACSRFG